MSQSPEDCISRVEKMVADNGQTWDLSPNDKEALWDVLGLIGTSIQTEVPVDTDLISEMVVYCSSCGETFPVKLEIREDVCPKCRVKGCLGEPHLRDAVDVEDQ